MLHVSRRVLVRRQWRSNRCVHVQYRILLGFSHFHELLGVIGIVHCVPRRV